MSLSTTVILQGRAQRITVREGTAKESGKPYRIVSAIVVGPLTLSLIHI